MKRLQLWKPTIGGKVKWIDPAAARDLWDDDLSDEENFRVIDEYLDSERTITDISGEGPDTIVTLDGDTQVPCGELRQPVVKIRLDRDPENLRRSLSGRTIVHITL